MYEVKQKKKVNYIGVDKNMDIVNKNPFNQNIIHFSKSPLPFEDNSFDGITILDVLEHIYNQDEVLKEFNRLLKPKGELIITIPKKHIFSFLDLGNLKFVFPNLHRLSYTLFNSKEEYEYKYVNNPYGLIGDIEKEKSWHQHFSEKEMSELLERNGFKVDILDGSSLFGRIFIILDLLKIGKFIPKKIKEWDCLTFENMNLFCKAKKVKDL